MNLARRFILKLTGATLATAAVSPLAASVTGLADPVANSVSTSAGTAARNLKTRKPIGTLIIKRGNGTGDRLLVLNNSTDSITVREITPGLAQVNGKVFDLNRELRETPLVVPGNSVQSCRINTVPDWQVCSATGIHEVRCSANNAVATASIQRVNQPTRAEHAVFNLVTG